MGAEWTHSPGHHTRRHSPDRISPVTVNPDAERHKLILRTADALGHARAGKYDCVLQKPCDDDCLDLRVSRKAVKRSLEVMNAILLLLEREGFRVKVSRPDQCTVAFIFGDAVPFCFG